MPADLVCPFGEDDCAAMRRMLEACARCRRMTDSFKKMGVDVSGAEAEIETNERFAREGLREFFPDRA